MAIWPTFVADCSAEDLKARLAFDAPAPAKISAATPAAPERRYGLRQVRRRLHQATIREAVQSAYESRCAFTGLPRAPAAGCRPHADGDDDIGQPIATDCLPMSKLHHVAFYAHLISIDLPHSRQPPAALGE
jgi:putative restriction endonuclease